MTLAAPRTNPLADDLAHILAHTEGIWENLREQNVFVTGGTGFFGRWLLESFAHANNALKLNARMVVLSRNPSRFTQEAPHLGESSGIHFVRGDVQTFDAAEVRAQLAVGAPGRYAFVIHAATDASAKLNTENPLQMIDTILRGTRAALEFAVATGASRFLLTSTGAVYGRQPPEITHIPEEYTGGPDPTNPSSAYGEGKRLAELLCACFHQHYRIEPVIARCFAFVGPGLPLDGQFAIGNFLRDATVGVPVRLTGDATSRRSYLYAADLVVWLWVILVKGVALRPYNVGSEGEVSIGDLARDIGARASGVAGAQTARDSLRGLVSVRYIPSTERARVELGLRQWKSLPEAIDRTMEWLRWNRATASAEACQSF